MLPASFTRTQRLGTAPVGRLLITLGVPGMVSMFAMACYNLINTFWIAKLGPQAMAAVAITAPYQFLMMAVGVGTGTGFGSVISQRFGAQDPERANRTAAQVFILAGSFGLLFSLAAWVFPRPLLKFFGATPDILEIGADYLRWLTLGAPFVLFSMMSNNILRGSGNTKLPMVFLLLGAGLNAILDPLCIFGWGVIPAWGVRGAAYATVFSQGVAATINAVYLLGPHSGFRFRWQDLRLDPDRIREIYRVGFPAFIMQFTGGLMLVVFNRTLAPFGSMAIAANGLVFRTIGFLAMPIAGIAQGLLPIVGYNFGAQKPSRVWRAVRLAAWGSASVLALGWLGLQSLPAAWAGLFSRDPEFLPMAITALRLTMLALPLMGPIFVWITTLQGLGRGRTAMFISLARQLVFLLPLLLVLPRVLGIHGVWLSVPLADALAFATAGWWMHRVTSRATCGIASGRIIPLCSDPVPDRVE